MVAVGGVLLDDTVKVRFVNFYFFATKGRFVILASATLKSLNGLETTTMKQPKFFELPNPTHLILLALG
ncbi:MAG: hypothetical protein ACJ70Z_06820 [Nitrososphaera sp.]